MELKEPESKEDLKVINELNDLQNFRLKTLNNKIVDRLALNDEELVVAYGVVKALAEAIFLTEPSASFMEKGRALKLLMEVAIQESRNQGFEQLHVFVSDKNLADYLEKNYGFAKSNDIVMVKQLL